MAWGWVAAGTATVVGGYMASSAATDAADTQAGAARDANGVTLDMYNQTRQDNMPALSARNTALQRLTEMLGTSKSPSASDVQNEAGYQFGLNQGLQAQQRQAAARGMSNSGQALTAAARYGTDYASTKYNDAFNRLQSSRQQQWNEGASLAGLGQTGSSQVAASGTNYANQASANTIGAGNAQAASAIASGNSWVNTGNQLAGWYASSRKPSSGNTWASEWDANNYPGASSSGGFDW